MAREQKPPRLATSYFESLLARIRAGDESAKADLIRDAFQRALRLTRVILRGERQDIPHGLTDHIHSVAYEKFARSIDSGRISKFESMPRLLGWFGKTINTTAIDEARAQLGPKRRVQFPGTVLDEASQPVLSPTMTEAERRLGFRELIEQLSDDEQELMSLFYEYEFKDWEIAEMYGTSRTTINRRKVEIHLKLKEQLGSLV